MSTKTPKASPAAPRIKSVANAPTKAIPKPSPNEHKFESVTDTVSRLLGEMDREHLLSRLTEADYGCDPQLIARVALAGVSGSDAESAEAIKEFKSTFSRVFHPGLMDDDGNGTLVLPVAPSNVQAEGCSRCMELARELEQLKSIPGDLAAMEKEMQETTAVVVTPAEKLSAVDLADALLGVKTLSVDEDSSVTVLADSPFNNYRPESDIFPEEVRLLVAYLLSKDVGNNSVFARILGVSEGAVRYWRNRPEKKEVKMKEGETLRSRVASDILTIIHAWRKKYDNKIFELIDALKAENYAFNEYLFVHPPSSPDLNLIENLWAWMDRRKGHHERIQTVDQLMEEVMKTVHGDRHDQKSQEAAKAALQKCLKGLFNSWPRRLIACIDEDGGRFSTKKMTFKELFKQIKTRVADIEKEYPYGLEQEDLEISKKVLTPDGEVQWKQKIVDHLRERKKEHGPRSVNGIELRLAAGELSRAENKAGKNTQKLAREKKRHEALTIAMEDVGKKLVEAQEADKKKEQEAKKEQKKKEKEAKAEQKKKEKEAEVEEKKKAKESRKQTPKSTKKTPKATKKTTKGAKK